MSTRSTSHIIGILCISFGTIFAGVGLGIAWACTTNNMSFPIILLFLGLFGLLLAGIGVYLVVTTPTTRNYKKMWIVSAVAFGLITCFTFLAYSSGCGAAVDYDNYLECRVCYKLFEKGTSDAKNIEQTKKCNQCWLNHKYGLD